MSNLTPWFPGIIKPVHVGVYEVNVRYQNLTYQHWSGSFWGLYAATESGALAYAIQESCEQSLKWRGLASNPAEEIHSCGYHCEIPACIKAQRDELRNKFIEGALQP